MDTQISRLGGAELPRDSDQRAGRAGAQQPARRHAPPGDQPRPRLLRAELARRRLPVPGRRGRVRVVPGAARGGRSQGPRQARTLRRSLHPGDAVLEQPDDGREAAHHQRVPLRAVEGADAGDPRAHGVRADERRGRTGRGASRRASGIRELPPPMPKVLPDDVTPEVTESPALSLLARPGDGSIRARRVAILVADGFDGAARGARRSADRRGRRAAVRRSMRSARSSRSSASRSRSTPPRSDARRCSSTRWCCPTAPPARRLRADGRRWSSSRTSTATASRSWRWATRATARRLPASRTRCRRASPIPGCLDGARPAQAIADAFVAALASTGTSSGKPIRRAYDARGVHHIVQGALTMAETGTLHDAFIDELRDTYDAEQQLTKALPKLAKAASAPELRRPSDPPRRDARTDRAPRAGLREPRREGPRQALRRHRRHHRGGQVDHGGGLRRDHDGRLPDRRRPARRALRDGRLWHPGRLGQAMGHGEAADLLQQTLDEEKAADEKLSGSPRTASTSRPPAAPIREEARSGRGGAEKKEAGAGAGRRASDAAPRKKKAARRWRRRGRGPVGICSDRATARPPAAPSACYDRRLQPEHLSPARAS